MSGFETEAGVDRGVGERPGSTIIIDADMEATTAQSIPDVEVGKHILLGADNMTLKDDKVRLEAELQEARRENLVLKGSLEGQVEAMVEDFLAKRQLDPDEDDDIVELGDIPDSQATSEIRDLFEKAEQVGTSLYIRDIADRLDLDLEQVVRVCNKLTELGEIGVDEGD